jgi:hypothetical protein
MTRRATPTKTEIERAVGAVLSMGLAVARIEIGPDGRITIITGTALEKDNKVTNEWDTAK